MKYTTILFVINKVLNKLGGNSGEIETCKLYLYSTFHTCNITQNSIYSKNKQTNKQNQELRKRYHNTHESAVRKHQRIKI